MQPNELAKMILLGLVKTAGGTFEGKTRLFKAFYLAHVYYAQSTGKLLSDWPIVRMSRGPGIGNASLLFNDLLQSKKMTTVPSKAGPFPSTVFHVAPEFELALDAAQIDAIKESVAFVDGKTAAELSEFTHEYSRSWNSVLDGGEIDVFLDIMDEEEFERLTQEASSILEVTQKVFADAG